MKLTNESKVFIVTLVTIAISIVHLTSSGGRMGVHMIHRELFFIPIILSCFWFGLTPGLVTAGIISILYAVKTISGTAVLVPTLFQIFTFILIAFILGTLVNHNEKFHAENVRRKELAALGNAAFNLGTEIQNVLGALRKAFTKLDHDSPGRDEIEEGFNRLDNLVNILSSFITHDNRQHLSIDINLLVSEQLSSLKERADSSGIAIDAFLDEKACPSKISGDSLKKLIRDLVSNAMDASSKGGRIAIRTSSRPTYNILEIEDQGTGIAPEHLEKIFHPFFTTKKQSHGLSLASNYKFIQNCGGDIKVFSTLGEGSRFVVKIPIDDPTRPLDKMHEISDWNPNEKDAAG